MTWEETIRNIRTKDEFKDLVRDAYFDSNLRTNVERFRRSEEFRETLMLIKGLCLQGRQLVDVGSGNGMATIAFALEGYNVHSIEPDPSETVGAGAIKQLVAEYNLNELVSIHERFGEDTGLCDSMADIVYMRQAMHHAHNLEGMMKESYRTLKPGGYLVTIRDHVIFDEQDKAWFLKSHPLHKFYGGENAFTENEYRNAMIHSGFIIRKVLRHYDSIINYFPLTSDKVRNLYHEQEQELLDHLRKKIGPLSDVKLIQGLYKRYRNFNRATVYDEKRVAGRLYTFISQRPV